MFASTAPPRPGVKARRWSMAALLLCGIAGECGWAQTESATPPAGEVLAKSQILTRPTGALVFLQGEYGLAGRAPYTVTYFLRGHYRIKTKLRGYEDWSTDYYFNGRGNDKISIKLSPKTRLKAFARSALVPGMGQAYSDQRVKGMIISALQFSSLAIFVRQEWRYRDSIDEFNRALAAFQNDANQRDRLTAAQATLDQRYELRQRWAIITASVYLYNLIDVIAFFPSYHRHGVELSMTASPPMDVTGSTAQVGVRARF
ncbi:MAG: DUF5683 domain-containing protein [candidate division KSB1 bacterium]|nr:DUF5683 domain-containing protein [candidate division KSB1 bacterium]MDZ7272792.1 DUF5683 domain-containing protein [candidate division KSB1 bacterium]MDZ7284184.1 DUF5683 domain-containing protein [candidate division KSB1 bacterium]MDZ7297418.1 DUF5683 domain-containing protein [candidate division KSB1 bacterium]MDZ7306522.1 DUF5683 domain-containing protein [candidate division KSB1 bacterium]